MPGEGGGHKLHCAHHSCFQPPLKEVGTPPLSLQNFTGVHGAAVQVYVRKGSNWYSEEMCEKPRFHVIEVFWGGGAANQRRGLPLRGLWPGGGSPQGRDTVRDCGLGVIRRRDRDAPDGLWPAGD